MQSNEIINERFTFEYATCATLDNDLLNRCKGLTFFIYQELWNSLVKRKQMMSYSELFQRDIEFLQFFD